MTFAKRPRRPELRESRTFAVPRFDTEVLDAAVLVEHASALPRAVLITGLADGRTPVRVNAARLLGILGELTEPEAQQVAVALRDAELPVRLAAAQALVTTQDPSVVLMALLDATLDPASLVAKQAVATIATFGKRLLPLIPGLLRKSPDWWTPRGVALIAGLGAAILPPVLAALSADDPSRVSNALSVLHGLDDDGMRAALDSLKADPSPAAQAVRLELGRALSSRKRTATASLREPRTFPVEGFDTDLLPREVLEKHRKLLPRALMFEVLQDGRVAVRVNALDALALTGPATAAESPTLCVMLKDGSASVRAAAARSLHKAQDVAPVVLALVASTTDPDGQVRGDVAAAVRSFGAAAVPVLMGALRVDAAEADAKVLPHLQALDDLARESLITALSHPNHQVRGNALAGLINLGHDALLACERRITALCSDPAADVQALARQAGSILARHGKPLLHEARPLPLEDFAEHMVDVAALKKVARGLESAALHALTRDGRAVVRANAWRGLASLGPLDSGLALEAAVACKDGEADVRREAATALRHCPEGVLAQVLPPLVVASRDGDASVAQAARQAVFSLGRKAAPHLVTLFGERDGRLHDPAVALAVALDADAVADVVAALQAPQPLVRSHAFKALTAIGGKHLDEAMPLALAALQDSYDPARVHAVQAIGQMQMATWKKQAGLKAKLTQVWRADASLPVRQAAERVLARMHAL